MQQLAILGKPTAFNSTGKIVHKVVQQSAGAIWFLVEAHEVLCKWISCRRGQKAEHVAKH